MKNYLIRTGVCSEVHHKEQYIPQKELEGAPLFAEVRHFAGSLFSERVGVDQAGSSPSV